MAQFRLGKYTGKIYIGEEIRDMKECGIYIDERATQDMIDLLRERSKIDCEFCNPYHACPEKKIKEGYL